MSNNSGVTRAMHGKEKRRMEKAIDRSDTDSLATCTLIDLKLTVPVGSIVSSSTSLDSMSQRKAYCFTGTVALPPTLA